MWVEGEATAYDPKLEEIAVVSGRFALLEKKDIGQGQSEWHRPDWKTQPPDNMKATEQDQDHPDGEGG